MLVVSPVTFAPVRFPGGNQQEFETSQQTSQQANQQINQNIIGTTEIAFYTADEDSINLDYFSADYQQEGQVSGSSSAGNNNRPGPGRPNNRPPFFIPRNRKEEADLAYNNGRLKIQQSV